MRVAVLTSGTGGNLRAVARLAHRRPDLVELALVTSDRPSCAALSFARDQLLPIIAEDFTAACGRASDARTPEERRAYAVRAQGFHDRIDEQIERFEDGRGAIDLMVLAYRRWIHGRMLRRWRHRMINQHPGDLRVLDDAGVRVLTGNNPVLTALQLGHGSVRTSTFLVDDGHDTGGILAQGPSLSTRGYSANQADADELELRQKRCSDWPVLTGTLVAIARGALAIDPDRIGPDGSPCFRLGDRPLPFGGMDLERPEALPVQASTRTLASEIIEAVGAAADAGVS